MFRCVTATEKEKKNQEIDIKEIGTTYKPNLEQQNPAAHPVTWQLPWPFPPPPGVTAVPQCKADVPQLSY